MAFLYLQNWVFQMDGENLAQKVVALEAPENRLEESPIATWKCEMDTQTDAVLEKVVFVFLRTLAILGTSHVVRIWHSLRACHANL